ncbi:hypothetical protein [Streptomyces sp. NPDC018031]|uniref:hypothetical protein n=1 Tax=Streptomyces sp. NPDC018031 TaxID=3365033 RepID=UPI00378C7FD6
MKKSVSRVVAAAAVVAALGLTTACNDDDSSGKDKGGKGTDKATTAPAAAPLTKAKLEQAALVSKDVEGFEITKMSEKEAAEGGNAKSDKAECQPVAELLGSEFTLAPTASVFQTYAVTGPGANADNPEAGLGGMIRLSAHKPGDAEKVLEGVRSAVKDCAGGFTATDGSGDKQQVTEVKEVLIPEVGEESVGFTLATKDKEEGGKLKFIVVRTGAQVTSFFGFNMTAPDQPEIPQLVVSAQVDKVAKAGKAKG